MISVKTAKEIIANNNIWRSVKEVALLEANQMILAAEVVSLVNVPSFHNSAMDGYALAYDDSTSYKVTSCIAAGDGKQYSVEPGEAARIFTGALVPFGADTVVQQELIHEKNSGIQFDKDIIRKGANIRLTGSQCSIGETVATTGTFIDPPTIGLLASAGISRVPIYAPPKVGVIITGDELQEPGTSLQFGQIYNSNGPVIEAYLKTMGIHTITIVRVADQPIDLHRAIEHLLEEHDLLLLTGGISVGSYDYVNECLGKSGVNTLFYKVMQKPGKPLLVGSMSNKMVFALPGNPASVITCFGQYVKPAILQMMGHITAWQPKARLQLTTAYKKKSGITHFLKGKTNENYVSILSGQESFNLLPFTQADCLVEIDENTEYIPEMAMVDVYNL